MKQYLLFAFFLMAHPAFADERCRDIDPAMDADGSSCTSRDLRLAEASLNATYKSVLHQLTVDGETDPAALEAKQQLIEAQHLWIKFRDSDCAAVFSYYKSGTIRVAAEQDCIIKRTSQRTNELKSIFDGP